MIARFPCGISGQGCGDALQRIGQGALVVCPPRNEFLLGHFGIPLPDYCTMVRWMGQAGKAMGDSGPGSWLSVRLPV